MPRAQFIEGPAGTGKTTYAIQHIRSLLDQGVQPEHILILVPQRTLGQPYQLAFVDSDWPQGGLTDIVTLGGLARRGLETFWPLVSDKAGFAQPTQAPRFLTIETAQYYMAGFVDQAVRTGVFDSVSIAPSGIMRQTLDNLSKAAVNGFSLDQIGDRLISAWGDRHSSRPPVYRATVELARQFRDHCLQNNLLDFSLQVEVFMKFLLVEPLYVAYSRSRHFHLVADNLEESFPVVADFIRWMWDDLDTALLLYDMDAGYRVFLGANPVGMRSLSALCDEVQALNQPVNTPPVMIALAAEFDGLLGPDQTVAETLPANPLEGFVYKSCKFYPQMVGWVADQVSGLVENGVPAREIVILAPFLGDSLRFSLTARLNECGVETVSHRPSRAVRDEPSARATLALMALAHPEWGHHPPPMDVSDTLWQVIEELDPVRAWLLTQIVYGQGHKELGSFDAIRSPVQTRITYRAGEKYERLRTWLLDYQAGAERIPPDHFLSRLFGEVLAQPGFGFHTNLEAGRIVAELVESARKFRQTLYPLGVDDWGAVGRDYFELVQKGLLAALYVTSWRDEERDAVFIAPAYTFLMRNRWVDYQFWLDVGSNHWWERLEQPLTHPYVLSRGYPFGQVWTDDMEFEARQVALRRLALGLVRRCRERIYVAISDLSEQGYEQRGPMLRVVQQIVQHNTERVEDDRR
jgi:hypothetical protein